MNDRRIALKQLAFSALGAPLLAAPALAATKSPGCQPGTPAVRFRLGVAMVSVKELPLAQAVAGLKHLGVEDVSVHRAQAPWEASPAEWQNTAQTLRAAGLNPACCGVIYLKNDEQEMRRMMGYVRSLGVNLFTCSPAADALPLLERMVKEYNLHVAIHNHGPEDKVFPSPQSVMEKIGALDNRIGLCLDVGHAYRAGADLLADIRRYAVRIYDVHLKDSLAAVGEEDAPVEIGRGKLDVRAILIGLAQQGYGGNVWLEYEKDPKDPWLGLAESWGYMKAMAKSLG